MQRLKRLRLPLLKRQAASHFRQAERRSHVVARRLQAGESHDPQWPGPESVRHGVTQLADQTGSRAGVHDDDGDALFRDSGVFGGLGAWLRTGLGAGVGPPAASDGLTKPVHHLQHQRPQGDGNFTVMTGGHQLPQRPRGTQPVQTAHGHPDLRLLAGTDASLVPS